MGRSTSFDENGLKRGPWTPEEDKKLVQFIQKHGHGSWRSLPKLAGLNRCGKSCRLRWTNYLRPDIKRGKFSKEEEQTILNLHSILGNKWSAIATHLPGRTDNEIKNFWNTHLKKKLIQMGFDPKTHCPRSDFFTSLPQLIALASLRDVMDHHPWEEHAARLQEAVQVVNFHYMQCLLQSAAAMNSSPNGLNGIADMNAINLLNSFLAPKDPILSNPCQIDSSSQSSIGGAPLQPLNGEVLLNCHSDLPPMNSGTDLSHEEETPKSASPPFVSENSISNGIRGTSSSDGSASPFWNELVLDDPFLHEIAFS